MNFNEFNRSIMNKIGIRPTQIKGISNVARIMDGCIFMGGPNLEGFSGNPYALTSRISFSTTSHFYFCIHFDKHAMGLYDAVKKLEQNKINNCKLILDDYGLFISTNSEINKGEYGFNSVTDVRVEADNFYYLLTSPDQNANSTINWINHRISSNVEPITTFSPLIDKQSKSETFSLDRYIKNSNEAHLLLTEQLITRFFASLLTKPFVILTGLSGSGKTKLAQATAQWICEKENQYCLIPVGADWTNREPLLGYPNALNPKEYVKPDSGVLDLIIRANSHPDMPHFLILDEMNLSHVERYFADFLSAMESKEEIPLYAESKVENGVPEKLKIPSNLFIIGTVNIDETTNMFSPKVLDRANTIEFRVTQGEMKNFLDNIKNINMDALTGKGSGMAKSFLDLSGNKSFELDNEINEALIKFFGELKKTGAEFGYRSATEILRLVHHLSILDSNLTKAQKIDIAIMQKLLPKLHGSRRKLCPVLETLGAFCFSDGTNVLKEVFENKAFEYNDPRVIYPLSLEKISRMYKGALDHGFASFAEA